jgi:molecular chaperone GrpE (heat shock protein)
MKEESKKGNEQKYPKVIAGVFIFNDKGELFLAKQPRWHNQYTCPGGGVELGETVEQAVIREVKEETNMEIKDIELLAAIDGLGLEEGYMKPEHHLVFLDHKAKLKKKGKIKLNEESIKYKWLKPEDWLKEKNLEKYTREVIEKYLLEGKDDFEYKYKRALADYQNLLKRTAEEKHEFAKYANEQLIYDIIPIYDNLKISLQHADKEAEKNGWLEGIKHVVSQFKSTLENLGVEEIKTIDKKFDPVTMEAIEGKGKKVKQEVKAGYKLNGKVIIPAKVILE